MPSSDDFPGGRRRVHGELDELFAELIRGRRAGRSLAARALTDVYLTEDPPTLTVTLDVAGTDPETLEVVLDGDVLSIRGDRTRPSGGGRKVYQQAEIDWGPFERHVRLDVPVDAESARVTYERGLLTIALPLAQRRLAARVLIGVRLPR